jgi:hypothetical protein
VVFAKIMDSADFGGVPISGVTYVIDVISFSANAKPRESFAGSHASGSEYT